MGARLAIGIDAGATKVAGLVVDVDEGRIVDRRQVQTPSNDAAAAVGTIGGLVHDLLVDHPGTGAVGVGAAALVDLTGTLRFAPNVAWREFPLAAEIERTVELPTVVVNDATAAAWGEHRFGAGRDVRHLLLVTVGSGIGGGMVVDGRLLVGAHGFAGEIGHIVVEPGGPPCGCGNLGCWEQVASGRALGRLGREAARDHPESKLAELAGGDPTKVTGPVVTQAAFQGDAIARRVLAEVGRRLGEGIAGLVNVLDPEVVVVGGGVADAGDLLLDPARRAFRDAVEGPDHRPEVPLVGASLGNDAGAIGAADLAVIAAQAMELR